MGTEQIVTIIIAIIGTLGGGAAWNYYQRRLDKAEAEELRQERQEHMYRDDLRERVAILETRLDDSLKERDKLMKELRELTEQIASMRVEVRYLKQENERLKSLLEQK
jgi:uncharacterized protein HemX